MLLDTLKKLNEMSTAEKRTKVEKGIIFGRGSSINSYDVLFASGAKLHNIFGPLGLDIGKAVSVANYPGKTQKYVILSESSTDIATMVEKCV